jgi:hypothetical protein
MNSQTIIAKQKCEDQFRRLVEKSLKKDNQQTINLNLMKKQSIYLNASKTQSKHPSMMQAQIQATNVR